MTVLQKILAWSLTRPTWQRDALRRLVQNSSLSQDDIDELTLICKSQHGLSDPENPAPTATPLARQHLPYSTDGIGSVSVKAIRNVSDANALAPNQTLKFAASGLTIVYGDNASGKSGYARILKRACRARNAGEPILPNVYEYRARGPASAVIEYAVDGIDQPPLTWTDIDTGPSALGAVSFFDSECAEAHVGKPNNLAFTPFGLDLFEKLGKACRKLQAELERLKTRLQQDQPDALRAPKVNDNTAVATLLRSLSPTTTEASIRHLATLNHTDCTRLADLRELRHQDPSKLAHQKRTQKQHVDTLLQIVRSAATGLTEDTATALSTARDRASRTAEAARVAATTLFQSEPLPEVGGDIWRELWEAARRYSEQRAYPAQPFPVATIDALCVLCQQPLGEEAAARFRRFEDFVRDDTQSQATNAAATFNRLTQQLQSVEVSPSAYKNDLAQLKSLSADIHSATRRYLVLARLRRHRLIQACDTGAWSRVPELPLTPADDLRALAHDLEKEAAEFDRAATHDERIKLLQELAELEDSQWLSTVVDDVVAEVNRLSDLRKVDAGLQDTDTTAISRQGTTLANEVVTEALRGRFANELVTLNIASARVELVDEGSRGGVKRYQIRLIGARDTPVSRVASEGEHRCIALAGFLAELATSSHKSALVFDDPVRSLDHLHRDDVANRLVQEASNRQVIVFTHDLVFAFKLDRWAEKDNMEPFQQYICTGPSGPGVCSLDAPLRAKRVRQCLDHLKRRATQIGALHGTERHSDYEEQAAGIYGTLRITWEQAVAEAVEPVLSRFERDVDTKNLWKLIVLTDDDCRLIDEQRGYCSRFQHSESSAVNEPPPPPDTLLDDIQTL